MSASNPSPTFNNVFVGGSVQITGSTQMAGSVQITGATQMSGSVQVGGTTQFDESVEFNGLVTGLPVATDTTVGVVKPDGTTVTIDPDTGALSAAAVEIATDTTVGVVKPDNSTITINSSTGSVSTSLGNNLSGLSNQSVSRVNLLTSPRYYSTMDTVIPGYSGAAAKGDCQQSWALITCTASNTTVTVGGRAAQSQTLSCSINAGEHTLTVASGAFDYIDQGVPITVPGAGLNGAPLVTWIDLVNLANGPTGNTQIILRTPAQTTLVTSSQTVVWGNWFGSGDVGKPIVFGSQSMATDGMGSGGGVLTTTIVTVTNSNTIIVALAPSASFSLTNNATNWQQVTWGSDDSAAVNAVLAAALIRGDRYVYTPAQHYVPSLANHLVWGRAVLLSELSPIRHPTFGTTSYTPLSTGISERASETDAERGFSTADLDRRFGGVVGERAIHRRSHGTGCWLPTFCCV